jgi:hypothetical protein
MGYSPHPEALSCRRAKPNDAWATAVIPQC